MFRSGWDNSFNDHYCFFNLIFWCMIMIINIWWQFYYNFENFFKVKILVLNKLVPLNFLLSRKVNPKLIIIEQVSKIEWNYLDADIQLIRTSPGLTGLGLLNFELAKQLWWPMHLCTVLCWLKNSMTLGDSELGIGIWKKVVDLTRKWYDLPQTHRNQVRLWCDFILFLFLTGHFRTKINYHQLLQKFS